MSLNAIFNADFTAFNTAVDAATAKMRGFETGASKVQSALDRMTDQFTGRRIVSEATLMVKAVEEIGGASKLTQEELRRVGQVAADAAAKLKVLGEQVPADIQKMADAFKKMREAEEAALTPSTGIFSDLTSSIASTAAGMVSAQAIIGGVTGAVRTMTGFVVDSAKAYASAEAADVKMTAALRAQSMATDPVIEQYRKLAGQFQQTTAFSDDLIQEMEALLIQVGDIMPAQMETALTAATNLASGLGIDLRSATELVAKAAAGHTEALGRYGITVDQAKMATEGFSAVLTQINSQFGGQAQAALNTTTGKVQQMTNAWNNVQEAVGKALTQSPLAVKLLNDTAKELNGVSDEAGTTTASLSLFAEAIGGKTGAAMVIWLEQLQDANNELEKMTGLAAAFKPPKLFEGGDPGAPAGLKVFDQQMKAFENWKDAAKEIAKVNHETGESISGLQATVDELDGSVAQGILYYNKMGVSLEAIATYYGVFTAQAEAVVRLDAKLKELAATLNRVHEIQGTRQAGLLGLDALEQQASQAQFAQDARMLNLRAEDRAAAQRLGEGGLSAQTVEFMHATEQAAAAQKTYAAELTVIAGKEREAHQRLDALREEAAKKLSAALTTLADKMNAAAAGIPDIGHGATTPTAWSGLTPKPIAVKPIRGSFFEYGAEGMTVEDRQPLTDMAFRKSVSPNWDVTVNMNVSGVFDARSKAELADAVSEGMKNVRQWPSP